MNFLSENCEELQGPRTIRRTFATNISMLSLPEAVKIHKSGAFDLETPLGELFVDFITFLTSDFCQKI
jgi:hypothetical protein